MGYIHFLYVDGNYETFIDQNYPHVDIVEIEQRVELYGRVSISSPLKEKPEYSSKTIYNIEAGSVFKITKYSDSYWRTEINGLTGFIGASYIETTSPTKEFTAHASQSSSHLTPIYRASTKFKGLTYSYSTPSTMYSTPTTGAAVSTGPRGGRYYYNSNGNKTYIRKR